jgi:hypothetical protein
MGVLGRRLLPIPANIDSFHVTSEVRCASRCCCALLLSCSACATPPQHSFSLPVSPTVAFAHDFRRRARILSVLFQIEASDMTAMEAVLAVDTVRNDLEAEADRLSSAVIDADVRSASSVGLWLLSGCDVACPSWVGNRRPRRPCLLWRRRRCCLCW